MIARLLSLFTAFLFLAIHPLAGQALNWVKQIGGANSDMCRSVALDSFGNIYSVGSFADTVDFDPGPGVFNLASTGVNSAIVKFDASGNFIWAKQFAGDPSQINEITVDGDKNLYLVGFFMGTVDFEPDPGVVNLTSYGDYDIFILKLDTAGNFNWAHQIGSTGTDAAGAVISDNGGNVYATGSYEDTVDFDPGPGIFNLEGTGVFLCKLDSAGNFSWARQLAVSNNVGCSDLIQLFGNIYVTGYFTGTCDFDPGPAMFPMTVAGNRDVYVTSFDVAGNFSWARQFSGNGIESGSQLATDFTSLYITGYFEDTADFDPGASTFNLISGGLEDVFLVKLDLGGNFQWAKKVGGGNHQFGYSVATGASGRVYMVGIFFGTSDFDPGPGLFNMTSTGGPDIFLSGLDGAGNFLFASQFGGTGFDIGRSLVLDAQDNPLFCGYFENQCDFDPGPASYTLTSNALQDMFILKLNGHLLSGAPELSAENEIRVFPNPATEYIDVHSQEVIKHLHVYSTLGTEVFYASPAAMKIRIPYLNAGIYMVRIETKDGVSLRKVVVVN